MGTSRTHLQVFSSENEQTLNCFKFHLNKMKAIGQSNSVLACKCIASFKSVFVMPEMPDIWTQQILKSSDCATWSFDSEDTCGLSQPLGALQPPRAALTWSSHSRSPWGFKKQRNELHQLEPQPAQGCCYRQQKNLLSKTTKDIWDCLWHLQAHTPPDSHQLWSQVLTNPYY